MKDFIRKKYVIVTTVLVAIICAGLVLLPSSHRVDYNTDVKPILNKKCISCHGGVKQQGGFSLLFREEALKVTESGKRAIVPGDPDASEMIRRLTLKDEEERMPYKKHPLPDEEIDLLRQWISEGAEWGTHWAYLPVKEPALPVDKGRFFGLIKEKKPEWIINEIDYFIHDKLKAENLTPTSEADKATILRRVSLDITGLPPSTLLAKQFLNDSSDKAYENLVDSLLASPQYGERWTALWMDMARYADTKGYERDGYRSMWRYRDWLIKSFNSDKPYDEFLIEQLAGDLLPNPTDAQYIATAFHRNTMTNDEGGTDNEEYRVAAVIDRVNTTWETLMGTTFACVQCHSHPYDPFRHEEYYKFMAFFNNSRDEDTYEEYPLLREYFGEDSLKFERLKNWLNENASPEKNKAIIKFLKTGEPVINSVVTDEFTKSALADTKYLSMQDDGSARLKNVDLTGKTKLMYRCWVDKPKGKWTIHLDKPNGPVLTTIELKVTKGWEISIGDIPSVDGVHDLWFSYNNDHLSPEAGGVSFSWFYFTEPLPGKGKAGYTLAETDFWNLVNAKNFGTTPVMVENPGDLFRKTNVFDRGNWLVKGDFVSAGVPGSLNPMPANAQKNRLGLAKWLTDKNNPLVSRTIVNRIWEQLYGHGIAETLEDLGTQGIAPTHLELLDWLSFQLMNDHQWSLKKLIKQMVMSATYRQDSKISPDLLQKDPLNKLYARGPRVRLSAEQIRDQALAVSGLLSKKMYGESVMPYQPKRIWLSPYSGENWILSKGEDKYRRAIYTFWKRTAPYPFMLMFDGVAREVCVARRITTNTPLQALVTLNDSAYLEMARNFAFRIKKENSKDVQKQISSAYEEMMYKPISTEKLAILTDLYKQSLMKFQSDKKMTNEVLGSEDVDINPETASLVIVTNALLNLDEWITKN